MKQTIYFLLVAFLILYGGKATAQTEISEYDEEWVDELLTSGILRPFEHVRRVDKQNGALVCLEYADPELTRFTGRGLYVWPSGEMFMGIFKTDKFSNLIIRVDDKYMGIDDDDHDCVFADRKGILVTPSGKHLMQIGQYHTTVPEGDFVIIDNDGKSYSYKYKWKWPKGILGYLHVKPQSSSSKPVNFSGERVKQTLGVFYQTAGYIKTLPSNKQILYSTKRFEKGQAYFTPQTIDSLFCEKANRLIFYGSLYKINQDGSIQSQGDRFLKGKDILKSYFFNDMKKNSMEYHLISSIEKTDREKALTGTAEDLIDYYAAYGGYTVTYGKSSFFYGQEFKDQEILPKEVKRKLYDVLTLSSDSLPPLHWGKWGNDFKSQIYSAAAKNFINLMEKNSEATKDIVWSIEDGRPFEEKNYSDFFCMLSTGGDFIRAYSRGAVPHDEIDSKTKYFIEKLGGNPLISSKYLSYDPDRGLQAKHTLIGSRIKDVVEFKNTVNALSLYVKAIDLAYSLFKKDFHIQIDGGWSLQGLKRLLENEEQALKAATQW